MKGVEDMELTLTSMAYIYVDSVSEKWLKSLDLKNIVRKMGNQKTIDRKQEGKLLDSLDTCITIIKSAKSRGDLQLSEHQRKIMKYWILELEKLDPGKTDKTLQDLIRGYKQIARVY